MAFKVYFKRDLNGETLVVINDNNGTNIQRILKGEHGDTVSVGAVLPRNVP